MTRQRMRKHSWDPYTSEIQRFSIYPRVKTEEQTGLKTGDIVTLNIKEVDDKGRGLAVYKGLKIIVYNANPGSTVKARIVKITGDTAYAEIIDTINDMNVEY